MKWPQDELELNGVDEDLAKFFKELGGERYRYGIPTEIQTLRELKKLNTSIASLLEIFKSSDNSNSNSGNANNNIKQEDST